METSLISNAEITQITIRKAQWPNYYGLSKISSADCRLRPITSVVNSLTQGVPTFLGKILSISFKEYNSYRLYNTF